MKKNGFTLIELLIVTVVIVTLMGIVFRLAGTGNEQKAKAETIARMQCIENALSGYYAAYGCYPPVPLQGRSRDIYRQVGGNGVQWSNGSGGSKNLEEANKAGSEMAQQIEAACRAQPIAALYPLNKKKWQGSITELVDGGRLLDNVGNQAFDSANWTECEVFQFGLLSFLLPRYLFMLEGDYNLYDRFKNGRAVGQWSANNRLPCLLNGERMESWRKMQEYLGSADYWSEGGGGSNPEYAGMISNIASQAVCARWMPNLKGIVSGGCSFFGVDTACKKWPYLMHFMGESPNFTGEGFHRYSTSGGQGGGTGGYVLDGMTIYDGWKHEFYYYSEPPYQSYRLWSAGANGLTYPPWLALPTSDKQLKAVKACIEDDIVHMPK